MHLLSAADDEQKLERLAAFLESHAAVREKAAIHQAYAPAAALAGAVQVGDDCAAIPDGDEFLLFAAEGMLPSFVASDPWFAGYSAVMVNISDIAAMGGRAVAVVDMLWTPTQEAAAEIWAGMAAASRAYGVPIVGGHTTAMKAGSPYLAAAVLGKARHLITSFDAQPGDDLLMAVDLRGTYRGDKPFWNASVGAPPERLRADLALLPTMAMGGRIAGKDISNGGIVGTLAMLLDCSKVGADLRIEALPIPADAALDRWLISFPSYGFLLSVDPARAEEIAAAFHAREIACATIGKITPERELTLCWGEARRPLSFA